MTAVLRILGGVWVGVALAVFAVAYGLLLIWDGTSAAATTLAGRGPLGMLGMAAILMPGLAMLFTAAWIDRQRGRRQAAPVQMPPRAAMPACASRATSGTFSPRR